MVLIEKGENWNKRFDEKMLTLIEYRHPLFIARVCRHDPNDRDIDEMNRQQLWWLDHVS